MAMLLGGEDDTQPPPPEPADPLEGQPGASPTVDADRAITDASEDLLNRLPIAQMLAVQATQQHSDGFVIGLTGPWGIGKSSLLNLMIGEIQKHTTAKVVRFDPWMFSTSEELVLRFLAELQAQLRSDPDLGSVATGVGEYLAALAPFLVATGDPKVAAALAGSGGIARVVRKKRSRGSASAKRDAVVALLKNVDRRLVVVIDDLDRLTPPEIRDMVRLVKLIADFPNTTYVLAYEAGKVAQALVPDDGAEGAEYLGKIVQLATEVPPVSTIALRRILAEGISTAVGELSRYRFQQDRYTNMFVYAQTMFDNVRDVRRYTNGLPGMLTLLGGEVELADVLALEVLRMRTPSSFALLAAAPQTLALPTRPWEQTQEAEANTRRQLEVVIAAASPYAEQTKELLTRLFPATERFFKNLHYQPDHLSAWRRELRVAHPDVLRIYLSRALPDGVLPVSTVEAALEQLGDATALEQLFDDLGDEQLANLFARLRDHEHVFPAIRPNDTVALLFNQQYRLRGPRRTFADIGAEYEVPALVLRLLRGRGQDEVSTIVRAALPQIETLSEKDHLVRMVGYRPNSGHELVSEADAAELENESLDLLLTATVSQLMSEPELLNLLLRAHGARPTETAERVVDWIEDDAFLMGLLAAATAETDSRPIDEVATTRDYQLQWAALALLVPEAVLAERVERLAVSMRDANLTEYEARALQLALEDARKSSP